MIARALRITDIATSTSTRQSFEPAARIYPQFTFTDAEVIGTQYLYYASISSVQTGFECSGSDFTLGALRRNGLTSFSPVGDVVLAPCQGFTFSSGKVCCEFREIPDDVESGDVLTIRYGDDSTLLHEVRSDNRLIEAEVETIDLLEGDYPLISVDSSKWRDDNILIGPCMHGKLFRCCIFFPI